jgi:endo-1,3(4)-beta-glucanase
MKIFSKLFTVICLLLLLHNAKAQIIPVGSGSYTATFPGTDVEGRNTYPSGSPNTSGVAASNPVPTNDWWSALVKNNFVTNLFNYPQAFKTVPTGLVMCYIVAPSGGGGSSQPVSDINPIIVGITNLNVSKATVSDFSDWTVTINWNGSGHDFNSTIGMGMPFVYFTKGSSDAAQVVVNSGTATSYNEMLLITGSQNNSNYAIYAPAGSTWIKNGSTYTSSLNSKNYWSMAFLPPSASNALTVANEYKKYAYVFPTDTKVNWNYTESTSVVRTNFTVSYIVEEGSDTIVLQGLLPHQWGYLASDSPQPLAWSYPSIRGEIKTLANNYFVVENKI